MLQNVTHNTASSVSSPPWETFSPPLYCADLEMTRDGVRPATWPLCVLPSLLSPPHPSSSPHQDTLVLVNSGFKRNAGLLWFFCRTSIKSRHILSLSSPVVREGESLTARCTYTPLKPHPLLLPPPEPSSPPHPWQPTCTPLSLWEQIKEWKVPSTAGHKVYHLLPPLSHCHITDSFSAADTLMLSLYGK